MPNIEIHGLDREQGIMLETQIFHVFSQEDYVEDMVVTRFSTVVHDESGMVRPFLRLVNSSQKDSQAIMEKLKQFGLDIEHLELVRFYPETKTRIVSPIVGRFFATPDNLGGNEESESYVKIGTHVEPDTIVCIVEAMMVMNEIKAETAGTIVKILATDGEAVNYHEVLFRVKPD